MSESATTCSPAAPPASSSQHEGALTPPAPALPQGAAEPCTGGKDAARKEAANLWVAAGDGDLERVREILRGGESRGKNLGGRRIGTSMKEEGLDEGKKDGVPLLTPLSKDDAGYTPVHAAVSYGHAELLRYLLVGYYAEEGAEGISSISLGEGSPAKKRRKVLAEERQETGTNSSEECQSEKKDSWSASDDDCGHQEAVHDGVVSPKAALEVADDQGDRAYHYFAASAGDLSEAQRSEILAILREHGADPKTKNDEGQTAFEVSCEMDEDGRDWFFREHGMDLAGMLAVLDQATLLHPPGASEASEGEEKPSSGDASSS